MISKKLKIKQRRVIGEFFQVLPSPRIKAVFRSNWHHGALQSGKLYFFRGVKSLSEYRKCNLTAKTVKILAHSWIGMREGVD